MCVRTFPTHCVLTVHASPSAAFARSLARWCPPPPPPLAMSVPFFAKALFDYEAVEPSELDVTTGDFLTVEEVNESGWCLVRLGASRMQRCWAVHACQHVALATLSTRSPLRASRASLNSSTGSQG